MATRSKSSVDMIEEAFIDYITPKTLNTMENENKCFFSVSLENGITITGESPRQVFYFLLDLKYALFTKYEIETNEKLTYSAKATLNLYNSLVNAAKTIENHINIIED